MPLLLTAACVDGGPTVQPTDPSPSFALPPAGATPSAPENGELIIFMHARPGDAFPAGFVPVHQVWVYADGRVITRTEGDPPSYEIDGVYERRLTPEGVDLLLSELLSTGLFERDGEFTSPSWGVIQVRNGDGPVSLGWGCAFADACPSSARDPIPQQTSDIVRVSEGLADLASWLPATAWESADAAAYVPSKYAICYRQVNEPWGELTPAEASSALPPAAQELLRGKDEAYDFTPFGRLPGAMTPAICSEVTIEQARTLEEILIEGGFVEAQVWTLSLTYRHEAPDPIGLLEVSFEPILPHGRWELMPG
jgi:hypothetical protein